LGAVLEVEENVLEAFHIGLPDVFEEFALFPAMRGNVLDYFFDTACI
jgi:hypothetical protein